MPMPPAPRRHSNIEIVEAAEESSLDSYGMIPLTGHQRRSTDPENVLALGIIYGSGMAAEVLNARPARLHARVFVN
jgi:hypothetical protein